MTANEISETTDVPLSTTHRKLHLLIEASILEERTEIRKSGHHTTTCVLDYEFISNFLYVVPDGFEPSSRAPKALMIGHYTTGLRRVLSPRPY